MYATYAYRFWAICTYFRVIFIFEIFYICDYDEPQGGGGLIDDIVARETITHGDLVLKRDSNARKGPTEMLEYSVIGTSTSD